MAALALENPLEIATTEDYRVREAIQQDFDAPIKESFQVPIANLERATREGRSVMTEVSKAARFFAFSWWGSAMGLGILLEALGYHFLEMASSTISRVAEAPLLVAGENDKGDTSCFCHRQLKIPHFGAFECSPV